MKNITNIFKFLNIYFMRQISEMFYEMSKPSYQKARPFYQRPELELEK